MDGPRRCGHEQDGRPSGAAEQITVELGLDDPTANEASDPLGLESHLALARARARLLGPERSPTCVGRYRIVERLGRGGMGVVYAARDDELDRTVAIKILRADLARSSDGRIRLVREAQAMARLSHPNVGHVYEVGHHGDQVFIAMEMIRGPTLGAWCRACGRSWKDIVGKHLQAGAGLAAAHTAGLVHRDYKPDNVLVGTDGRPRVLDFGLARPDCDETSIGDGSWSDSTSGQGSTDITRTGTVVGTPAYMAPEQLLGAPADARADQFSFCVALFESLYGRRPFLGSTITELTEHVRRDAPVRVDLRGRGVPRSVHATILRGLEKDPSRRYPSMEHLLTRLCRDVEARPRRGKVLGAVGVAVAVGLGGWFASARDESAVPDALAEGVATEDPWAAIVADSDLPDVIEKPLAGDPTRVTVHRLRNGLTVYVAPRAGEPLIDMRVVVRANHDDERTGQEGVASWTVASVLEGTARLGAVDFETEAPLLERAHELVEQLDTLPPERRRRQLERIEAAEHEAAEAAAPGESAWLLDAIGVRDFGMFVGRRSIYFGDVPRNRFAAVASIYAEMLRRPVFRNFASTVADDVELSRWFAESSIAELTARRELAAVTGNRTDPVVAGKHAHRLPLHEVRAFHETYYRPNNTAIVLVGDITAAEALPVIEAAFGDWEPAPIPKPESIDRPFEGTRTVEVEDAALPTVNVVWSLPEASHPDRQSLQDLVDALGGPDGLLAAALAQARREDGPWLLVDTRTVGFAVAPLPGESLADAEAALLEALDLIEADRLPAAAWERAIARQQLEANRWAMTASDLAMLVADSYATRRDWADVAVRLAAPAATRSQLLGSIRQLRGRGTLIIRKRQGEPVPLAVDPLPIAPPPPRPGVRSDFSQSVLDQPITPLEPQFLVEGRHFEETARGFGRVITTHDDGPLFRLRWTYPVGAAHDPWACDAVRAKALALVRSRSLRGIDAWPLCRPSASEIVVLGVQSRLDELLPVLIDELRAPNVPDTVVRDHVERTLALREQLRRMPPARADALHAWALHGSYGVDALLPDDGVLRRRGATEVSRALALLQSYDPDVLYVGDAAEAVLRQLPQPDGRSAPEPVPLRFRRLDRPTVFLLDAPGQTPVDVRVTVVPPIDNRADAVLAELFGHAIEEADTQASAPLGAYGMPPLDPSLSQGLQVHVAGCRCATEDVASAIGIGVRTLQGRPGRDGFEVARSRLEAHYRSARIPIPQIPTYVQSWPARGSAVDPRLEQWLTLAGLDFEAFDTYAQKMKTVVPIVSIVADADTLDLDALASHGEIVRVDVETLLRDPDLDDALLFDYL